MGERTAPTKFIANSVGAAGGLLVGTINFLMGAPWWSLPLCAAAGLLIGMLPPAGKSDAGAPAPLIAALRLCRSLPLWDRLAMSALLVVSATAVYIGLRDIHILTAFVSLIAIYYFAIPPKNSFAVQSPRELGLLGAFALLAFITSATLAVLTGIARTKDGRQPQQ